MVLHVRLKLRYGVNERWNETFSQMVEPLERHGWKLLGAYQTLIGEITEVVHLWNIDDPNTVPKGLFGASAETEFSSHFGTLSELVLEERTQVMLPTPYCPQP
jgi:hypothetical protein